MSMLNEPLKSASLSRLVVDKIRQAIFSGEIKPGDILPSETEFAKGLGVSKSSVREAIKMLEAVGVVEIKRGIGTILNHDTGVGYMNVLLFQLMLNQGTTQELIAFRRMFEIAYTEMAILSATEEDLEKLTASVEQYAQSILDGIVTAQDDLNFHRHVLEATHNQFIINLGIAINALFSQSIDYSVKYSPNTALADHQAILEAIKEKDCEKAKQAIGKSMDAWKQNIDYHFGI